MLKILHYSIPPFSLFSLLFFQMLPIILKNSHSYNNYVNNIYFELYFNLAKSDVDGHFSLSRRLGIGLGTSITSSQTSDSLDS